MRWKKIYLEITNACNLNCSFCIKNKRKIKYLNMDEFKIIIDKIKGYTKEVYFHVLGEPLIHPNINEFINYATINNLKVNITTNGYYIKNIYNNKNIYRLNISLHSFNIIYKKDFNSYMNDIFDTIDNIRDKTFVSLRLWIKDSNTKNIISYINKRYSCNINDINNHEKIKITNNLIIDTHEEFIWPDLNNNYYNDTGTCYGLINHIGILSDGTIIPCCLDSKGDINLGNIFNDSLDDIYNKELVQKMIKGFKNNKKICELCKHCNFKLEKDTFKNEIKD